LLKEENRKKSKKEKGKRKKERKITVHRERISKATFRELPFFRFYCQQKKFSCPKKRKRKRECKTEDSRHRTMEQIRVGRNCLVAAEKRHHLSSLVFEDIRFFPP
jgi:hypothetical protein